MKIAIMQPYFLPYIGYWQLMNVVDTYVIYDNIKFSKKGWIHRNRLLLNNKDEMVSLPLKKDSDYLDINQRKLSDGRDDQINKYLRKIEQNYRKAPQFNIVYPLIEKIFLSSETNLFDFVFNSILIIKDYLNIRTSIIKSSDLVICHNDFKGEAKVLEIVKELKGTNYINAIGGRELYNKDSFSANKIKLEFLESEQTTYKQFKNDFIPWLSIIDVMMFLDKKFVIKELNKFKLE